MKKKFLILLGASILSISLASCQLFNDLMEILGGASGYNPNGVVVSSKEPISDISTPPAGDLTAKKASYNYGDYIDNSVYPLSSTPSIGQAKLLVIPVWFNDSSTFISTDNKENVKEDIRTAYFGTNEETGWRSVKTYYEEESHGALTLNGTVSDWYEPKKSYKEYTSDPASEDSGAPKTSKLVEDAADWYFKNNADNKTDYDCDGDGYLDGVMLIYAAPDFDTLGRDSYDNLWAYCFWVQDPDKQKPSNPGVNVFFWASYDFMYGKETASSRTGYRYHAGDTSHSKIDAHTYIHEMGHMFGLEDYYDYSDYAYQPAGGFSMQDHNVSGHDPFSSFALGWGKAYIPTETTNIDLKPFSTSGEMILLTPKWNEYNSPFDEYILLEYYTDTGLNSFDTTYKYMSQYGRDYPLGTKEYGIRLWHVDARLLYTMTGEFSASKITSNPKIAGNRVTTMMTNTYYEKGLSIEEQPYISLLGEKYANYNLLQMIRNSSSATYKPSDFFTGSALFKKGDSFSLSKYSRQFVNNGKLNNNSDLGFSFTVNACNNNYASISIKKL